MPIYEYVCVSCGHALEALQKLSEPPLSECPVCGESTLKKKVSAAGFRLKGGGWYETDFKSDRKKNVAGDGASDSASGGEAKSDEGKKKTESSDSKSSDASSASSKPEPAPKSKD